MKALLTSLLALVTLSGYAQQLAPTPPPTQTHADSAEVIHQAFRHFRHRDRRGIALTEIVGISQVVSMTHNPSQNTPFRTGVNITGIVACGGLLTDYVVSLTKLSKRREEEALQRFELHQPQSQYVQRMVIAYASGKRKR